MLPEKCSVSKSRVPQISTNEACLLYTSDAADERSSVDLGGRRIIKKKTLEAEHGRHQLSHQATKQQHNQVMSEKES